MIIRLNQIKESKHKHPYKIYKVPVQPYLFYHLVVSSAFIHPCHCVVVNQEVKHDPAKYVETMETCDEEKEVRKIWRSILIDVQVGPEDFLRHPLTVYKVLNKGWCIRTNNKVCPLPSLATQEANAS